MHLLLLRPLPLPQLKWLPAPPRCLLAQLLQLPKRLLLLLPRLLPLRLRLLLMPLLQQLMLRMKQLMLPKLQLLPLSNVPHRQAGLPA